MEKGFGAGSAVPKREAERADGEQRAKLAAADNAARADKEKHAAQESY